MAHHAYLHHDKEQFVQFPVGFRANVQTFEPPLPLLKIRYGIAKG